MNWNVFQTLFDTIDAPLIDAIKTLVSNMESAVASILLACMTIYVALTGIMILLGRGDNPLMLIVERVIKGATVASFLQAASFNQYVTDFVLTTLPVAITSAVSGSTTVGASAFDKIWNAAFAGGLMVAENLGITDFGMWIVVVVYWAAAVVSIAYCFLVWIASHVFLGLFVIVGPLAILAYLFGPTRALFERWIGAVLSMLFLQLFVVALLSVILKAESAMLLKILKADANPFAQIKILFAAMILFLVAYDIVKQLPSASTSLVGGIYFHANTVGRATFGAAAAYVAAAVSGARSAAAGAGAAAQTRLTSRPAGRPLSGATP